MVVYVMSEARVFPCLGFYFLKKKHLVMDADFAKAKAFPCAFWESVIG